MTTTCRLKFARFKFVLSVFLYVFNSNLLNIVNNLTVIDKQKLSFKIHGGGGGASRNFFAKIDSSGLITNLQYNIEISRLLLPNIVKETNTVFIVDTYSNRR